MNLEEINELGREIHLLLLAMKTDEINDEILDKDLSESINVAFERLKNREKESFNEWAETLAKKFSVYND
jgi:hypothetical protein